MPTFDQSVASRLAVGEVLGESSEGVAGPVDLSGAFAPLSLNTFSVLGDSITARGITEGATWYGWDVKGYWVWAWAKLRKRFRLVYAEGGEYGDSTQDILDRLDAYMTSAAGSGWHIVLAGTNDCAGSVEYATIIANLGTIYDAIMADGGRVVAVTIPPITGASTAVDNLVVKVNSWIKQQARARKGLYVADIYPKVTSGSAADWLSGFSADNIHPSPTAAAVMGGVLYDLLDPLIPHVDVLPQGVGDAANLITNPNMTGTTGTVGTGGSGSVATGWGVDPLDGVASVFTCSKVARTDGMDGSWQQVNLTSGQVKIRWNQTTGWSVGEQVYAICEFETDDDFPAATNGNYFRLKLACTKTDFGDAFAGYDFNNTADTAWPASTYMLRSGVWVTPVITIPATTNLRIAFEAQLKAPGATARIGRAGIYKYGTGPAF